MVRKIASLLAVVSLSAISVNSTYAFGCSMNGPPWDKCEFAKVASVPDTKEAANIFYSNVPSKMKSIHNNKLTIDSLNDIGLLGAYSEISKNGAAIELLMWECGFKLPKHKSLNKIHHTPYSYTDFYNNSYGVNFKYFVLPFSYKRGWSYCQYLRFIPNNKQIVKARQILESFDHFIKAVTTPYTSTSDQEDTQDMIKRQHEFNTDMKNALDAFKYDEYMAYANKELNNYLQVQNSGFSFQDVYGNIGCIKEIHGKLLRYSF